MDDGGIVADPDMSKPVGCARSTPGVLATLSLLFPLILPAPELAAQTTTRVSVHGPNRGNGPSQHAQISANGHFVVYTSTASNLVDGDTNWVSDVFVHDRRTGETVRASVDDAGNQGNSLSQFPRISAGGRFVAFESLASNLVDGDTNGALDVFVHDRQTRRTTRVSLADGGAEGNSASGVPCLSGGGRFVAFESLASNLVDGDSNESTDVFVHDRQTGATTRVSVDSRGRQADGGSAGCSVDGRGRYVAFESLASNLVDGDTNRVSDVFVHDRQTGKTTRVSVDSRGRQANGGSAAPSLSGDGRFVGFGSYASNLVDGDTNQDIDVFVHDRQTGETIRVSVDSQGRQANGSSGVPAVSADGRWIAFHSFASNLVDGDTNGSLDIFVNDRETGSTTRTSLTGRGLETNGLSRDSTVSGDGRFVAFESEASNLVARDDNGTVDVFVRDRGRNDPSAALSEGKETGPADEILGRLPPGLDEPGAPPPAPVRRNPARKGVGVFLPPLPRGDWKVPPPIRPTPAPPEPSETNRNEEGDKNVPPPGAPCFRRSGGFPTPTLTGGLESPPSYPPNSGPTGAQRRQPQRRGGQECPPSGGPMFSKEWGFSYPLSHGGTGKSPLLSAQLRPYRGPAKATATKRGTGMSPLRGPHVFLRSGGFPTPTLTGGLKVPPPIRPTPALTGPSEGNRNEEGDRNVPPPGAPCFRRSGGFPTPTLTGGLKVPPPIRATPAPPEPSEGNRSEEGDKNVPPPGGGQVFSEVWRRAKSLAWGWFRAPFAVLAGAEPASVQFTDVTEEAGIRFQHFKGETGKRYLPETMGSGVAVLDFDQDGWMDLFFVNGWRLEIGRPEGAGSILYRNRGDGTFGDVTREAGLGSHAYGMGAAAGDYDNDGFPDLYVTNLGLNRLYRNNGDGTFSDVTFEAGVGDPSWGASAAWLDADNDGHLDLFVTNYVRWTPSQDQWCGYGPGAKHYCTPEIFSGDTSRLFRNLGGGRFRDVTTESGLSNPSGKALGVALWDFDGNGLMDLVVAEDTQPDKIYLNRGGFRFEEVGTRNGFGFSESGQARAGMGVDVADADNDGGGVVAVTNFSYEGIGFYRWGRGLNFIDQAVPAGIGQPSLLSLGFGLLFLDYDLDGWQDLLAVNGHIDDLVETVQTRLTYRQRPLLFRNRRDGRFLPMGREAGPALDQAYTGRGAAAVDYDNDGDLDLVMTENAGPAHLLRNQGGNRNHWIQIRLVGNASNRDGIGTLVTVKSGSTTQRRYRRSGSSYLSESDPRLTFGLGESTSVDRLEVRWPSGITQVLEDVAAGRLLVVKEPGE